MNFKVPIQSDFLFARPSFGSGVARALHICGGFDVYNSSTSESEADLKAIASDWAVVGHDLEQALKQASAE